MRFTRSITIDIKVQLDEYRAKSFEWIRFTCNVTNALLQLLE